MRKGEGENVVFGKKRGMKNMKSERRRKLTGKTLQIYRHATGLMRMVVGERRGERLAKRHVATSLSNTDI